MTKLDRMARFEAPRVSHQRPDIDITLKYRGRAGQRIVPLPARMAKPDVITYSGHIFVHRDDEYIEATVWPIIDELDA